jgi:hypothetical protein
MAICSDQEGSTGLGGMVGGRSVGASACSEVRRANGRGGSAGGFGNRGRWRELLDGLALVLRKAPGSLTSVTYLLHLRIDQPPSRARTYSREKVEITFNFFLVVQLTKTDLRHVLF